MNEEKLYCTLLCKREVPELTEHHLVPKSRGGKETVSICRDCHRQIHALFENKILENDLNTIELLIANEEFARYLKWVAKKPFGAVKKARRSKETRSRGRRG